MRLCLLLLTLIAFPWALWAKASCGNSRVGQKQASPSQSSNDPANGFLCSSPLKRIFGAHSFLRKHGIAFDGWLQFDSSHAASGGMPGAIAYDGQYLLDISATVDTKQLMGWQGGTALVDMQTHSGPNIVTHQVPAIQDPDNMDAPSFTSLDRAWYQQELLHQKLQMRVGVMYIDDQFFTVPYGQNFISLDFSSDASISTFVLPTYPKGSFGGDAFVYPVKGLYFSFGVFNDHSTELPYDPGGELYLTEEGWQSNWHGLPYKLQVGAWRDTGRFQRFLGGIVHHASGFYVVASQKLWQPAASSDRGVGMVFQFGTGPPSVAVVRKHFGAGVVWTGPVAARPHDEMGLAFSDGLLTAQNSFLHGYENEIEGYYQFYVSPCLTIQPDIQYWQHPGGMTTPNTLLLGLRMEYTF